MKCPVCGAAELVHDTRDVPFTYKGETAIIPAVTGDFCPACAESVLDMARARRFGDQVSDFRTRCEPHSMLTSALPRRRLPIGIQNLREIRERDCYYVDKSGMAIYSHFAALGLGLRVEDATSRGRIDMTLRFRQQVFIFEFKVVADPPKGEALRQLRIRDTERLIVRRTGVSLLPRARRATPTG